MKLETFFEKFEQFADAPNAVAKMRELVLELAIQGKLIEQDANDVSAIASLRKCTRAVRELEVNDDDTVPSGWASVPLGCVIASNIGGGTPSKQNSAYWNGSIPWASVKDIQTDKYLSATIDSITEEGLKHSSSNLIPANRLIVVTRMGLGKLAINKIPTAINQDLRAIEPNESLDLDFAYLLFKALKMVGKGVTVKGVRIDVLHSMTVALPPLAEQKRIVAKVDELMALCDRLEAQQQERASRHAALARASLVRFAEAPTPANLDFLFHQSYTIPPADLRKSILTLAVQGKLVPQKPGDGLPQEAFIGLTPLASEAGDSGGIPDQWELCSYRSLTSLVTSGSRGWKEYYSKSGAIFVRTQNIKTDKLVLDDVAYVDLPTSAEGMRAQILKEDILITITGANVTKAARVEEQIPEAYVSQHIALTRPRWSGMSKWLHLCFISHGAARGTLEQLAYGDKPGLNLNNIRDLILPIPPLAEQRRIVAKVDQLMALVDQLETQLSEARAKSAALLEAVIHELLNPSAEIIDLASYRAAIGCYTIRKMCDKPYFGRTAAMKMFYLAQAHVGMQLGLKPEREAAGPLDQWIYRFEEEGQRQAWFKAVENTSNGKMKVEYQPGKLLAEQAAQGENLLSSEQRREFDRLLNLLSDKKTEEVEIIATLFAAWNDFLLDGRTPSDDEIVTEVRTNWHEKKERFTPAVLRQWMGWLRKNSLMPQGRPPRTVQQSKLQLN